MREEWKAVPGWPDYEVSNHGRVKALARVVERFTPRWNCQSPMHRKERMLKLYEHRAIDRKGQPRPKPPALMVALTRDKKSHFFYVHRLVLEAFIGPCPTGQEGCHNDGDPLNNRLDNLRWDTHVANVADSIRHGTFWPKLRGRTAA